MSVDTVSVAIQGQQGSYHDQAAGHYFGEAYEPQFLKTFGNVFDAVDSGAADYGATAVENSLVGSIDAVYDLLGNTPSVSIMGEVYLGIHHSLIGVPGARLEDIKEVHSHPVALAQCTDFLGRELPNASTHPEADTVASVMLAKERGDVAVAAIAGASNAAPHGMEVLQEAIENNPENYTRFLILGRTATDTVARRAEADKTSLLVERLTDDPDELSPGTLYKALGYFANNGVGLTKVESRPIIGRPWHYKFYLDCGAGAEDPRMKAAMQGLLVGGAVLRELGTYKRGETI
jgi:prephenate dehydratase